MRLAWRISDSVSDVRSPAFRRAGERRRSLHAMPRRVPCRVNAELRTRSPVPFEVRVGGINNTTNRINIGTLEICVDDLNGNRTAPMLSVYSLRSRLCILAFQRPARTTPTVHWLALPLVHSFSCSDISSFMLRGIRNRTNIDPSD